MSANAVALRHAGTPPRVAGFDQMLATSVIALLCIGVVMVASSSVALATETYADALYHLRRHMAYLAIGLCGFGVMLLVPMRFWERDGWLMLPLALLLLVLVVIPGIGHEVNGSMRWIRLGPINLQASEFARLGVLVYVAGYLVRQSADVQQKLSGLLKPIFVVSLLIVLLLMEPDFGAAVVLMSAVLGMIFLSGVRLLHFSVLILATLTLVVLTAISQPYRMQRLTSFTDPWADPFNSGYQLTQALIAFGRGEWAGVGLGNSIQKLFYLPEAHTDFVFAILAEETGLIGSLTVIALFSVVVWRSMLIGLRCQKAGLAFQAYLAWGLALMLGVQAFINLGVNAGLLPTKGITLPLLSYGGSSLLASCLAIGLLFRIEFERRQCTQLAGARA